MAFRTCTGISENRPLNLQELRQLVDSTRHWPEVDIILAVSGSVDDGDYQASLTIEMDGIPTETTTPTPDIGISYPPGVRTGGLGKLPNFVTT